MRSFLHRARSLSERASAPVVHLIPVSARTQVRTRLCTLTSPSRGTTCPLQATARIAPRFRRSDGPFSASRRPAPHGRAPLRPDLPSEEDLGGPAPHGRARLQQALADGGAWTGVRRPAPHGRAPLRPPRLPCVATVSVVPPLTGGLRAASAARRQDCVVPPLTGGLRCGSGCGRRRGPAAGPNRSSRPSRAGSVAAAGFRAGGAPARSSRPSRAGSVAAASPRPSATAQRVVPPLTGGLRCGALSRADPHRAAGRPAPHGRAPLRRAVT